ncbi:calcium/sodium antiporter [Thiorhodococcus minor]|uniref:Calcium/sodium antiporter n=1 Tax=Thiorhodococcus minor TaxID=57489 RepID=A0A6M0K0I2_9GAMM|nr:calcium/sodium antiporter [Thiorhodococcus minor]NEV62879.1 calcium/sodium antiporter [Thiorhodococcus minor]
MPDWIVSLLFVLLGFAGLIGGGDSLVRSASALAAIMRISPLVIGLTVVAFGTSAPELAVTLQSSWSGATDLAVGNVIGSNIANVLLVLGVAALVAPLAVHSRVVRIDVPLVILASAALWVLASNGRLGWIDGSLLSGALLAYLVWSVRQGKREAREVQDELVEVLHLEGLRKGHYLIRQIGLLLAGLLLLAVGARLLVMGAVDLARVFGVSELVIGLTVVAIGTSLPEVVTCILASLRGKGDIAVGNVVGSNLFNILAVIGLGALVSPRGIPVSPEALAIDMPIMLATAVACLPVFFTGMRIDRREGAVFVLYFVAYIAYVVMRATHAPYLARFEVAMLGFVIPLTLIALGFSLWQCRVRRLAERQARSPAAAEE